jgi:succinate dehydrogenase/fumarate reductase flavoprotein subunit
MASTDDVLGGIYSDGGNPLAGCAVFGYIADYTAAARAATF